MQDILEKIEKMSVMELNDLVKAIEEKFGVSAAAPVAADSTFVDPHGVVTSALRM